MSCPPLHELLRLAGGTLEVEDREALLKHLSACPSCRKSWSDHSLAAELADEPLESAPAVLKDRAKSLTRASASPLRLVSHLSPPGSPAGKARPGVLAGPQNADAPFEPTLRAVQEPWTGLSGRASKRWRGAVALAASLLVAAGLGWWTLSLRDTDLNPHSLTQREGELSAVKPILAEPAARGRGGGLELGWSSVEGALDYLLTIADAQGDIVHEVRITHSAGKVQTSIVVERMDGLVAGRTYVWDVVARLPDGTEIESGISSFVFGNDG